MDLGARVKAEIVGDWAAVESLAPEWNELLRRSRADSPFLTWEWIAAWRAAVGGSVPPLVVVVRDGRGALVGLGPFYLSSLRLGGVVRYRALRILGDQSSGAEYSDWIVREDKEEEAARAIALALAEAPGRWDCLWAPAVAGWTGAPERVGLAAAAAGLHCHERPRDFSAVELPADYASFERSLSENHRSMLKRRRKQVMALPGASFERCVREEDRPAFLEALFDLNHRRWSAEGQVGTFVRKAAEARFYREFTRKALERGWLALFAIKIGGELKAVQAGYVYGGVCYQTQEGFDPDGPSGIGNVLRSMAIERLVAENVRTYDFLGEWSEHKRRWGATRRTGCDFFIGRRGLKTAVLFSAAEVWPTGRFLRPASLEPVGP